MIRTFSSDFYYSGLFIKVDKDRIENKAPLGGESLVEFLRYLWSGRGELPFWAREVIRKSLHIGVIVLALPIRWWGWWYGLVFAGASMIWNSFGMPRFFRFTFRDDEETAGYSRGMLSYPVTVFLLVILFPLPVAASQWATLSIGDGFATLVGRFFGKRALPWNREKTWEGVAGFFVMATLGALFFFWWSLPNTLCSSFLWQGSSLLAHIEAMSFFQMFIICAVSTAVAAFFESLPIPYIDDNVAAPLAGALTKLGLCYLL